MMMFSFQLDHLRRINAKILDDKDSGQTIIVRRNSSDGVGDRLDAFRGVGVGVKNDAPSAVTFLNDVEVDDDDDIDLDIEVDPSVLAALGNGRVAPEPIVLGQVPVPAPRIRQAQGKTQQASVDSVSLLDELAETIGEPHKYFFRIQYEWSNFLFDTLSWNSL